MASMIKNWKFDTCDCLTYEQSDMFAQLPARLILFFLMHRINSSVAATSDKYWQEAAGKASGTRT